MTKQYLVVQNNKKFVFEVEKSSVGCILIILLAGGVLIEGEIGIRHSNGSYYHATHPTRQLTEEKSFW